MQTSNVSASFQFNAENKCSPTEFSDKKQSAIKRIRPNDLLWTSEHLTSQSQRHRQPNSWVIDFVRFTEFNKFTEFPLYVGENILFLFDSLIQSILQSTHVNIDDVFTDKIKSSDRVKSTIACNHRKPWLRGLLKKCCPKGSRN